MRIQMWRLLSNAFFSAVTFTVQPSAGSDRKSYVPQYVRFSGWLSLAALVLGASAGAVYAAKGDLKTKVPRSAPLLQGKTLDLRFADFAQGIWVRDLKDCPADNIDRNPPGTTLAIYRGLWETPSRICQVYGAELGGRDTQRAALNCLLTDGGEAIELVTVQPRGPRSLLVQEGERTPVQYRFCEKITPVMQKDGS